MRAKIKPPQRQVQQFRDRGFVVVKGALLADDFTAILADLNSLVHTQTRKWCERGMLPKESLDSLLGMVHAHTVVYVRGLHVGIIGCMLLFMGVWGA